MDHIVTNSRAKVGRCGVLDCGFSDHLAIFCTRVVNRSGTVDPLCTNTKRIRSLKNYSKEAFCDKLRVADWSKVYLSINVDEAVNQFTELFHGVLDNIAPFREIRTKKKSEPWINSDILAGNRKRDSLFRRYRKDKTRVDLYREYCQLRNRIQRDVKLAKSLYFRNKIEEDRNNSSKLWSHLKSLGYDGKASSNAQTVL